MIPPIPKRIQNVLPKPYYDDGKGIVIYHGDSSVISKSVSIFDLMITDPPYGIKRSKGMDGGGTWGSLSDKGNKKGKPEKRRYESDNWDNEIPSKEFFDLILSKADKSIIWGAQYFAFQLPVFSKCLVWNKENKMPSYSDCELAYTTLEGNSCKMFTCNNSGFFAKEKERFHPTQKPVDLIRWCIGFVPECETIFDPFMGSGTTLRAAKDLGKKCTGIEREEKYCEIAARRLQQEVLL